MDAQYVLYGVLFEWDSGKAAVNLRKHGIAFEKACEAFFDPFVFHLDDETVEDEAREAITGITIDWQILYVVYVLRESSVRLISARRVTRSERRRYEDQ